MPNMNGHDIDLAVGDLEPAVLRSTLGAFATGVTIITTVGDNEAPVGLAANSFTSVSLDPPLILWSLALTAPSLGAFRSHHAFAVNILCDQSKELALRFSRPSDDKFADVDWEPGYGGAPVLKDAAAVLECETDQRIPRRRPRNLPREGLQNSKGREAAAAFPQWQVFTDRGAVMTTFTVAIAGFGWWGQHFAKRLADHPFIRIAGIVEPFEGNHAAIRELGLTIYDDLARVVELDEVDAVVLATPNLLHEEQVILCAEAGKHVFCEKPLGLTAASARRSVEACRKAGVQLGVGHERRFEPGMQALKAAIGKGQLGTIMHAEAAFSHDKLIGVPKNDWRTTKAVAPAAGMTAMGIHLTDLLISFFGRVEVVQAMTASRSLGWETGDVVTVQLGFEAGMTATLSAVLHTPHFIRMHVFGTDRWIEVLNDSHPDTPGGKVSLRDGPDRTALDRGGL